MKRAAQAQSLLNIAQWRDFLARALPLGVTDDWYPALYDFANDWTFEPNYVRRDNLTREQWRDSPLSPLAIVFTLLQHSDTALRLIDLMFEALVEKTNHAIKERVRRLKRNGAEVDFETMRSIISDERGLLAARFIRAGFPFDFIEQLACGLGREKKIEFFARITGAWAAARQKVRPLLDEVEFELISLWDGSLMRLPSDLPPLSRWSIPAAREFLAFLGVDVDESRALQKRCERLGLRPIRPFLVNLARAKEIVGAKDSWQG
jgi:hypothetical protein